MATDQSVECISLVAGEDLNDDTFKLLTLNSSGRAILATAVNQPIVGVLAENPKINAVGDNSNGRVVSVAILKGVIKVLAGGTVTAGNCAIWGTGAVAVDGGALSAVAADSMVIGVFKESGVINQVVEVIALPLVGAGT